MKQKINYTTPITEEQLKVILKDYPTKEDFKNELSNYPTKEDLKNELSNYPTKEDLKNELSNYPTKEDLDERLTASQNALRHEMKHEFTMMRDELDIRFTKFTNLILTAIDPLLQELKTRQQERAIVASQISEIRNTTNDHEKRITKLESHSI